MRTHLIAYTAGTEQGVANVPSDRSRPTWRECADVVPGFTTGRYLGLAPESEATPVFTLRYDRDGIGEFTKTLTREGVEAAGALLVIQLDVFDIAVLDADGTDVTFDFACFV